MALAQDTPIIVLDEPTVYLDIAHQMQVLQLIRQLANQGKTMIVVLHDLIQALRYGDDIALIQDGTIQAVGTSEEIYQNKHLLASFDVAIEKIDTPQGQQYYYVMND
jgi:iron complex transport system ATP-binding protein